MNGKASLKVAVAVEEAINISPSSNVPELSVKVVVPSKVRTVSLVLSQLPSA